MYAKAQIKSKHTLGLGNFFFQALLWFALGDLYCLAK